MTPKANSLADRWTRTLPWARRAVLAGLLLLAALSSGLSVRGIAQDPQRPAGWERVDGDPVVLREPDTFRILRRETPDGRDRGGPGGADPAILALLPTLGDAPAPLVGAFGGPAPVGEARRLDRPQPRAPPVCRDA